MADSIILLVEEFKRLERKRKAQWGKLSPEDEARLGNLRKTLMQRLHGGSPSDRRKELRIPANLRVKYRSGQTFINNYINNLSSGGVFVSTPKPLPLDSIIKLHLVFEDKGQEIEVEGKVVWESTEKVPLKDITRPGMGIKFIRMSDEAREIIDNIVHDAITEQARTIEEQEKNNKTGMPTSMRDKKDNKR